LGVYSPTINTQVSFNAFGVVAPNGVEFNNIAKYDIPDDNRGMVNANIDLTADQLTYTINDNFYTNYVAGTFTGPILDNRTPGGPLFYTATISPTLNTLGLEVADVAVVGNRLTINLQSKVFHDGDGFTLNLGFLDRGTNSDDTITGGNYSDRLVGFGGNDHLFGGRGLDRLVGGNGNDVLDGGGAGDRMAGGSGNDWYVSDNPNDRIIEAANAGIDTIFTSVTRRISDNVENLTLTGTAEAGYGNGLSNVIHGNDAANILSGAAGSDWLYGGAGNDTISGGAGFDHYVGEGGSDTFVFTVGAGRDAVHAYESGVDTLDLSGIDANGTAAGDQAFDYIQGAAFSGAAGELRYAGGILSGDVNGDGVADFTITLLNHPALPQSDLVL